MTSCCVQLSKLWSNTIAKSSTDLGESKFECEVADLDYVVSLRSCMTKLTQNGGS